MFILKLYKICNKFINLIKIMKNTVLFHFYTIFLHLPSNAQCIFFFLMLAMKNQVNEIPGEQKSQEATKKK